MKRFLLSTTVFLSVVTNAQVGINTTDPHKSSILDIESNNKGVLLPRLTEEQREAIANPAKGLMIYNTTSNTVDVNIGTPEKKNWQSLSFHISKPEAEVQPAEVIVGNIESSLKKEGAPVFFEDKSPYGSWNAVIYDKSNFINKSGKITKISYLIDPNYRESKVGACSSNKQSIYMKWVDYDYFMNEEYEDPDSMHNKYTKVFEGEVSWVKKGTMSSDSWTEISLTTPFPYKEDKYLIVFYKNDYSGSYSDIVTCLKQKPYYSVTPKFIVDTALNDKKVTKNKKYSGGEKTSTIYPVTKFNFN